MLTDNIKYYLVNYSNAVWNKTAADGGVLHKNNIGWKNIKDETLQQFKHTSVNDHILTSYSAARKPCDNLYLWIPNRPNITHNPFLNKSIAIYGGSGTGKTTFLKNILDSISDSLNQCYVICPTNEINNTYDNLVQPMFIYNKICPDKLEEIINRQKRLKRLRNNYCNNLVFIKKYIAPFISLHKDVAELFELPDEDIEEFQTTNQSILPDMIYNILKPITKELHEYIIQYHSNEGVASNIVDVISTTIKCKGKMRINSVIIIDDATEDIKESLNRPGSKSFVKDLADLFTTSRHYNLTLIVVAHAYTTIPVAQRNNVHVNCFTDTTSFSSFFSKSNGASGDIANEAKLVVPFFNSTKNTSDRYVLASFKDNAGYNFYALKSYEIDFKKRIIQSKTIEKIEDNLNELKRINDRIII